MSAHSLRLSLSRRASHDLQLIQRYSFKQWGADQARAYDTVIERALSRLQQHPNLGRDRDDLVAGLRTLPVGRHIIYYRLSSDALIVDRILHQRMNVTRDQLTR